MERRPHHGKRGERFLSFRYLDIKTPQTFFKIYGVHDAFSILYLVLCIPTLHINDNRNRDVVLDALIAEFIALCVEHHMTRKVLETQDFYEVPLCSNIIVSTCRVLGNISTAVQRTA